MSTELGLRSRRELKKPEGAMKQLQLHLLSDGWRHHGCTHMYAVY